MTIDDQKWHLTSPIPANRFYVYRLSSEDVSPFYAGKGTGDRIFEHEREARLGCDCRKCLIIRGIWRRGGRVVVDFLFATDNEQAAYDYEFELIEEMGLEGLAN